MVRVLDAFRASTSPGSNSRAEQRSHSQPLCGSREWNTAGLSCSVHSLCRYGQRGRVLCSVGGSELLNILLLDETGVPAERKDFGESKPPKSRALRLRNRNDAAGAVSAAENLGRL